MIKAPSPNPVTTSPVARPCLSGNQLDTATTGVTYAIPKPIPPINPKPMYSKGKISNFRAK